MDSEPIPRNVEQIKSSLQNLAGSFEWLSGCGSDDLDSIGQNLIPWVSIRDRASYPTVVCVLHSLPLQLQVGSPLIEDFVRTIRSSQNRLSRINRLPEDVLTAIFEALVDIVRSKARPSSDWKQVPQREWLHVNQVCRHWRRIALATPLLWTSIYLHSSATVKDEANGFAAVSLKRSGVLPLVGYCAGDPAALPGWKEHSRRFRELYIRLPYNENMDGAPDLALTWARDSPMLEILVVDKETHSGLVIPRPGSALLSTLHLPRLKTLIWSNDFDWNVWVSGNLRHLVLTSIGIPISTLLNILSAHPSLEDLMLHHIIFQPENRFHIDDKSWLNTLPVVDMPSLKHLDIREGSLPELIWVLDHKLMLRDSVLRTYSISSIANISFPDSLMFGEYRPLENLFIDDKHIIAYNEHSALYLYDTYGGSGSVHHLFRFLDTLLRSAQPPTWTVWLALPLYDQAIPKAWIQTLTQLQNVFKLVLIIEFPLNSWVDALANHPKLFPSLVELHIDTFRSAYRPQSSSLADMLEKRKKGGHPIRRLYLANSPGEMAYESESFDKFVGTVIIDDLAKIQRKPVWDRMGLPTALTSPSPDHTYWDGVQLSPHIPPDERYYYEPEDHERTTAVNSFLHFL
ncbi:hypothetical protein BDY19DRAFT_221823 [Irpex rosettiformis]|uniref:Uncharacterized protein n=1 Tax=Irpex rosettiformis TaxID=378272 RepID=A0ACB8U0E7_9APHY|nr:hypothetical protein BDY19DRAFT_221823 [Irpex rosettiformis]